MIAPEPELEPEVCIVWRCGVVCAHLVEVRSQMNETNEEIKHRVCVSVCAEQKWNIFENNGTLCAVKIRANTAATTAAAAAQINLSAHFAHDTFNMYHLYTTATHSIPLYSYICTFMNAICVRTKGSTCFIACSMRTKINCVNFLFPLQLHPGQIISYARAHRQKDVRIFKR